MKLLLILILLCSCASNPDNRIKIVRTPCIPKHKFTVKVLTETIEEIVSKECPNGIDDLKHLKNLSCKNNRVSVKLLMICSSKKDPSGSGR